MVGPQEWYRFRVKTSPVLFQSMTTDHLSRVSSALLSMFVYLVHHGDSLGPNADPQRPLSSLGHRQVEVLSRQAAALSVCPAAIWHSGKLRARQTAQIYWRACNPVAEFSVTRWMRPDDPPLLADLLQVETRDVMLVGHIPHLERLRLRLLQESASQCFPSHGAVALERLSTGWSECWRLELPSSA